MINPETMTPAQREKYNEVENIIRNMNDEQCKQFMKILAIVAEINALEKGGAV